MPQTFTNTRAGLITVAWVDILPGETAQIPSAATLQGWSDAFETHEKDPAKDKGPGPGHPSDREEKLLEAVRKSSVVRAGHLREGQIILPEPPAPNPGAVIVTPQKPLSLAEFDGLKALALIQLETDLGTLAMWSKAETRVDIMSRLRARAESLAK